MGTFSRLSAALDYCEAAGYFEDGRPAVRASRPADYAPLPRYRETRERRERPSKKGERNE